jgi:cellobiose-specific phosphotransferase system component IIC
VHQGFRRKSKDVKYITTIILPREAPTPPPLGMLMGTNFSWEGGVALEVRLACKVTRTPAGKHTRGG